MPGVDQALIRGIEAVRLLERESQLASLAEYAGEARRGAGRRVLIAGEAGVGKSALVEQVERDLPNAIWYWGACDGLFIPRPPGPLCDIASGLGGNPVYVGQAVQAGMSDVPVSARDAVLARAVRLGSGSRAVLDAAALIGTKVEVALLDSVVGCPPSAIDELLASGLLTGDGMAL